MKVLFHSVTPTRMTHITEYNGKKFKLSCDQTNGGGYAIISVMDSNGEFKRIATHLELGIDYHNLYFLGNTEQNNKKRIDEMEKTIPFFDSFIKAVY
jgi:hypothetical protein